MNPSLIYFLLLSIAMVIAPHALHLPVWVSVLCGVVLLWRTLLTYFYKPLPSHKLLIVLTVASIGGITIEFQTVFGREVGVTLLVLLATLKLMEIRAARDVMALIFLACFIVITNFFYSQSMVTAVYMLATLFVVVTTWLHLETPNAQLKARFRLAGVLLLQAIPLTLILFVLFPRVQGPLWGLPQDAHASSGLGDTMSPGSLSKLSLSDAVAFRVNYESAVPRRNQMYWRGPVLWNFDGRTWTPGHNAFVMPPKFTELSQPMDYRVTLEPHNKSWLFALDVPYQLSIDATLTDDFQILSKAPVTSRLRYRARSHLVYHANVQELDTQLRRALALPAGFNPRTRELATTWRAQQKDDALLVNEALRYFNQQGFTYTLEPPPLGKHSVDDFLFNTKQGFCEYYASSFVFLMRAAHIPARVVTGYLGGEFNGVGKYYIVRQSDAHAWAEVWLSGRGWVRVDPTAAIAPGRIENNLAAAVQDNSAMSFMARNPPQWLRNLSLNWDAAANQWNQWVLGYDSERQFDFLTRLGMEVTWQKMVSWMGIGLALFIALFSAWMLRHLFHRTTDKIQDQWLTLCNRLAKVGLAREPSEAALAYAQRVAQLRPDLARPFLEITQGYNALRYGVAGQAEIKQQQWLVQAKQFARLINKTVSKLDS
ncbi:MAG: DUF3488 and transglutaminase-like domain-containing protein [Gallionella sp.]|nr:DUF3488 and transglutaminase-like domain-containing protein [Gallionella sp.]MDD4959227.1 DUF3488 and transglutaminase-like domain-containing protein [Gallionella sp.]